MAASTLFCAFLAGVPILVRIATPPLATFVAVALPPLGVPALGLASGIAWSRVYLRAHHPTDVAFGAFFGLWAGVGFGLNYRRRKEAASHPVQSGLEER